MLSVEPSPKKENDMRRQYEWIGEIIAIEYEDIHNFYEEKL